jgi:vacuolar-type H+-ATPase subunit I/STV1|tara:strand:+ start:145 stop:483 length:339 start_codon:yes stop_codon:yes gene_type:complete
MSLLTPKKNMSKRLVQKRDFTSASRLEINLAGQPTDKNRQELVQEIKELIDETNDLLMRRDGLFKTPKKEREARYEAMSEKYAENMVKIEELYKKLKEIEKGMELYDPSKEK